jgi:hypothetical protein
MLKRLYYAMGAAALEHLVDGENGMTFYSLGHTYEMRIPAGTPMRTLPGVDWVTRASQTIEIYVSGPTAGPGARRPRVRRCYQSELNQGELRRTRRPCLNGLQYVTLHLNSTPSGTLAQPG